MVYLLVGVIAQHMDIAGIVMVVYLDVVLYLVCFWVLLLPDGEGGVLQSAVQFLLQLESDQLTDALENQVTLVGTLVLPGEGEVHHGHFGGTPVVGRLHDVQVEPPLLQEGGHGLVAMLVLHV